jgi:hypothetical protein
MAEGRKLMGEFLSELAENALKLSAYLEKPDEVMERSGLTEDQREILRSDDLARIRDAIREEYASAAVLLFPFPVQHISAPQNVIATPPDDE